MIGATPQSAPNRSDLGQFLTVFSGSFNLRIRRFFYGRNFPLTAILIHGKVRNYISLDGTAIALPEQSTSTERR